MCKQSMSHSEVAEKFESHLYVSLAMLRILANWLTLYYVTLYWTAYTAQNTRHHAGRYYVCYLCMCIVMNAGFGFRPLEDKVISDSDEEKTEGGTACLTA